MATESFTTSVVFEQAGEEIEADVLVEYQYYAGYRGDFISPPEPASVEIHAITAADRSIEVPERFYDDEDLLAECFADHFDRIEDALERRAEAARDDRIMEQF
jgi:hypothetical protein